MPSRSIVAPEGRATQECAVASRTGACLLPSTPPSQPPNKRPQQLVGCMLGPPVASRPYTGRGALGRP
jgi:hypothetical protein